MLVVLSHRINAITTQRIGGEFLLRTIYPLEKSITLDWLESPFICKVFFFHYWIFYPIHTISAIDMFRHFDQDIT